jgi:hypothetical protein
VIPDMPPDRAAKHGTRLISNPKCGGIIKGPGVIKGPRYRFGDTILCFGGCLTSVGVCCEVMCRW